MHTSLWFVEVHRLEIKLKAALIHTHVEAVTFESVFVRGFID